MGAAWIVENEHTIIFTPEFNTSSYEFQSGALDPREMGFKITNHDRVTEFIESLRESFPVSKKAVLVGQKIREFIKKVESFDEPRITVPLEKTHIVKTTEIVENLKTEANEAFEITKVQKQIPQKSPITNVSNSSEIQQTKQIGSSPQTMKFFNDLLNGKLKDEEILLIHYAIDTARYKLGTGWQATNEVQNIETWEDVLELRPTLSSNYAEVIRRLELKKLTEVSDTTGYGNPKEVSFVSECKDVILNLPEEIQIKIDEILSRNIKVVPSWNVPEENDLPF